jgi:restriction system protein
MPIPEYQTFMLPLLRLTSKKEVAIKDAIAPMAKEFALTPKDMAEPLPSGQNKARSRVHWALFYLMNAGLLERPARGVYRITAEGQKVLAQKPDRIDVKFLSQYESFRAFRARGNSETSLTSSEPTSQSDANDQAYSEESVTPDERLTEAYAEIESALLSDIKEKLLSISPTAFERLIVELMKCLKYGARGLAQHVGGRGDGGLDGLVAEDILGLDSIYLQAKLYTNATVGSEKIQAFAGAMDGQSVTKGVFVTTSTFTKSAIDYAARSPKHLKLIDGNELARLMFEHGLGVRVHKTFEIKRLDLEFFNDLED